MGGFDVKPGATTARDIAHARMPEPEPGKRTRVGDTGEAWIDHGPVCAGRSGQPGCFWEDDQRNNLIIDFQFNVESAKQQFHRALDRIRLNEIIARPDDLNWFLSLALDLVGMHFVTTLARSINRAAGPALQDARRVARAVEMDTALRGEQVPQTWHTRARDMILGVTPQKIEALTNSVFVPAKAEGKKQLAAVLSHAPSASAKSATEAYIDQSGKAASVAFRQYRLTACGHANDAELTVLWTGMQPENHDVSDFQPVLEDKIKRFKQSGVSEIGTKTFHYGDGQLRTTTRVVYVQDIYGSKTPWYQKQHQDLHDRGHSITGDLQLDHPVPEEFREPAMQRSEQVWGPTPTIDDGFVRQVKATGQDVDAVRRRLQANQQPPLPANSVFAQQAAPATTAIVQAGARSPLYAPGTVFPPGAVPSGLPQGSVFAPQSSSGTQSQTSSIKQPQPDPSDPLAAFRSVPP